MINENFIVEVVEWIMGDNFLDTSSVIYLFINESSWQLALMIFAKILGLFAMVFQILALVSLLLVS